jgi:hypothetical protein
VLTEIIQLQFIIEYATYSLDCWNGIFTMAPLNQLKGDGESWAWYKDILTLEDPKNQERLRRMSTGIWDILMSEDNTPVFDFLSHDLFSAVDRLAQDIVEHPAYFAASGTVIWDDFIRRYTGSLMDEFKKSVRDLKPLGGVDISRDTGLVRKLEWISHAHGKLHYAPILPLVTPNVLDCMAQAFGYIPHALTEVSV